MALLRELAQMVPGMRVATDTSHGTATAGVSDPAGPLVPVVIAGDFNAQPHDPVCELLRAGELPLDAPVCAPFKKQRREGADGGVAAAAAGAGGGADDKAVESDLSRPPYLPRLGVSFGSAYADADPAGKEPAATNFAMRFKREAPAAAATAPAAAPAEPAPKEQELFSATLDYIYYSRPVPALQPTARELAAGGAAADACATAAVGHGLRGSVLRLVDVKPLPSVAELAVETALPNSAIPSDHLPLQATFRFVPLAATHA